MNTDLSQWLEKYGQSHRHPSNIILHKICVPLILFSALGMIFSFSSALLLIAFFFLSAYYLRLSRSMGLAMVVSFLFSLLAFLWLESKMAFDFSHYLIIFIVAWVGQFIGHKIEGKRPSFFEDLQFLLIGPLWVLHSLREKIRKFS